MKRNVTCLTAVICLFTGIILLPAHAELGLQQTLTDESPAAVGVAVQNAAKAILESSADDASKKAQIIEILNEAALTGDEAAIRYTLVGLLVAGGPDLVDFIKQAIGDSDVAKNYPELTASTVAAAGALVSAGGGNDGGGGGGGEDLGGGAFEDYDPFSALNSNPFDPGGDIDDGDKEVTDT